MLDITYKKFKKDKWSNSFLINKTNSLFYMILQHTNNFTTLKQNFNTLIISLIKNDQIKKTSNRYNLGTAKTYHPSVFLTIDTILEPMLTEV